MTTTTESPRITIKRGGQQFGPYSPDEVLVRCREQRLLASDLALVAGSDAWAPLGLVMTRLGQSLPDSLAADPAIRYLVPVGRSGFAIAAGYLALFSVLIVPGPLALACGLLALRSIARRPELLGRGRAWFGIVAGGLATVGLVFLLVRIYEVQSSS
jgi:hypothetical protein